MRWVTRVSGGKVFVLNTVDWLEHEYTTSSALKLEGVLGVDKGVIFPCFSLYRRYYGLHNITIEGTHLNLKFTPTDIKLVKVKGNLEGKVLMIPSVITQIRGCAFFNIKVDTLDVSHFDTSKMTNMNSMFDGCQAKELDVSHFDTSQVTDMSFMFCNCLAKELDVSHFDISKVKKFSGMFRGYKGIIVGKERFPKEAFT